jgi:DNA mismatch repair protein MutS2
MHQAGLHVPAEAGSRLPVFRDVFADIGDEQSIAQSLSTFSGHLRSIIRIVERAGPGTLVLLDELGAGTDPTEGSALAQALLDHFIRSGALVAATTHYAEIKVYAHEAPAARNANVEFDLETLSPTYRLTIGLPGGSQAFAIAERLGLPDAIVADARGRLSENQAAFEATLASIRKQEGEIAESVERARAAEARAADALRTADDERRRARRERDEAVKAARDEAQRIVESLRDDVAGVRRRLERETVTAPAIDAALARAEQTLDRLPEPAAPQRSSQPKAAPVQWRLGDRARSRTGGWEGRIAALEKGGTRATLEAGGLRVSVAVDDLEPAVGPVGGGASTADDGRGSAAAGRSSSGSSSRSRSSGIGRLQLERARTVASSLDLRGARVDEALDALGRYLDDAALAGLDQVVIIHGLGTGALRDAVRETLGAHPLVKSFRAGERGEGGDGATIVRL